jgi:copper homeostasis protein
MRNREETILIEIAIASVEDAMSAQQGGADRLELNSALRLGGLTPSLGTFLEIQSQSKLPVVVMVRPRSSGFCYSDSDYRVMERDIDLFRDHGAEGIVFGILRDNGEIDLPRCRELLKRFPSQEAIFHRAFDLVPNPQKALEQLIELGFRRIMTSGQKQTALEGSDLIRQLIEQAKGRIEILPASGIQCSTVREVLSRTGCNQIHASLRTLRRDPSIEDKPKISFSKNDRSPENCYESTNISELIGLKMLVSNSTDVD